MPTRKHPSPKIQNRIEEGGHISKLEELILVISSYQIVSQDPPDPCVDGSALLLCVHQDWAAHFFRPLAHGTLDL